MDALTFSVEDLVPENIIVRISDEMAQAGFSVDIEKREGGPQASAWLYVPTIIVAFFAKPFLEELAKRAAEDCYPHLKRALGNIVKLLCARKPNIIGKQPDEEASRYSLMISFYFALDHDRRVKFLIREDLSNSEYQECMNSMCDLLLRHVTSGSSDLGALVAKASAKGLVLLDYNFDAHGWNLYSNPRLS